MHGPSGRHNGRRVLAPPKSKHKGEDDATDRQHPFYPEGPMMSLELSQGQGLHGAAATATLASSQPHAIQD